MALTTAGTFAALFAANSAATTIDFTQSSYDVDENSSYAQIGVKLTCQPSENPTGFVSVSYDSSDGTATAGSSGDPTADYTAVSGTLTWGNSGSWGTSGGDCGATRNFYVPIFNNDAFVEDNETINLSLNNGNTAVLTILENGVYDFSSSSYSVDEDAGVATIGVIKHCSSGNNSCSSPSVSYSSSNGTATAGSSGGDYTAVNGSLTWGASGCECGTTRTFNVPIQDDSEVEGNETVNLSLSNGNTSVLTILDNDSQGNQPTFDFTQSSYNVDEGAGSATIGVTMSCPSGVNPSSASVSYSSSNGTATAGSSGSLGDYTTVNSTLTWGASGCGTTQTFSVPIQEDSEVEGDETVNLNLSNGNTAVLTIIEHPNALVDCEHAVYSLKWETLTIPYVKIPVFDYFSGQPTERFALWTGSLKQLHGVTNRFKILPKTLAPIMDDSSTTCPATYTDGTLFIPYIDVLTGIFIGNEQISTEAEVF